ncbi:hypothetical protein predicted by Glimmer/Critica [Erwinia amylovora CFBP1430]|uniref:Uncharacterized protein n=1 Tax=Erwinia amylovora (strain CFBP1430) TaxID=665029 RepID=D4HU85_ERWAC|nr:hypothetical protein predicted by Glimmer/Critica [Erwinia amylovora CFBP1430]
MEKSALYIYNQKKQHGLLFDIYLYLLSCFYI